LRVPSLRSVCFNRFYFTRALCQATANALLEGTAIINLDFQEVLFSVGDCAAILAKGFSRNTSVSGIKVEWHRDEALYNALSAALPSNSMLQQLSFKALPSGDPGAHVDLSPLFLALGKNKGLKTLAVGGFGSIDESLCAAMRNGFGTNKTLESLQLHNARLCHVERALWCRALSFLRANKVLKTLQVGVQRDATASFPPFVSILWPCYKITRHL
jgi:hypothetical protein